MIRNLKFAVYFAVIAVCSYTISLPYLRATSGNLDKMSPPGGPVISFAQYAVASGVNVVLMTFVLSWIGASLSDKAGLKWDWIRSVFERKARPAWDRKYVLISVVGGILISVCIAAVQVIFMPFMPEMNQAVKNAEVPPWIGLTTVFQGGVVEEVMIRFGFMTLAVWALGKLFSRKRHPLPGWIYTVSIFTAAVLFGIGHLGAAQALTGTLTAIIVVYIVLANSLGGIVFGYLYWKKGLEYAVVSHMTADIVLHAVIPLAG
ncbi:CPBP family intramembrane glutamic endopeptidase [Paenibacillus hamazuiensis]|uniref:CPBP family intramembrane glutamic endopeptidase n=1 Tax=Paenibacillus hamazuiensis TaxID=2936508 RepID=UPI00200EB307|nr:CPBP family intramembrane glutamic endopeptidase [Paenibacillus hamazuiensis]